MRKLKEYEKIGTFTSVCNDKSSSINSPCIVNTKTKQIVKIYKNSQTIKIYKKGQEPRTDEYEFVTIDDVKYPVKSKDEKNLEETYYWFD